MKKGDKVLITGPDYIDVGIVSSYYVTGPETIVFVKSKDLASTFGVPLEYITLWKELTTLEQTIYDS